jgi:hypothetical protein
MNKIRHRYFLSIAEAADLSRIAPEMLLRAVSMRKLTAGEFIEGELKFPSLVIHAWCARSPARVRRR